MDSTTQMWPMDVPNMPTPMPMATDPPSGLGTHQGQQQQGAQNNAFSGNGGVFMGVSTPPRGTLM